MLMGTRSTDPHGGALQFFSPTSLHWPPCMRVCPVLTWSYHDVWAFLRGAELPACELYARGYTSLGSVTSCLPNPLLLHEGGSEGSSEVVYLPAWRLLDGAAERLGRAQATPRSGGGAAAAVATASAVVLCEAPLRGGVGGGTNGGGT